MRRLELSRLGALKAGVLHSRRIGQNHRQAGWSRSFHDKGLRLSFRATIGRSPRSWPRSGQIVALWSSSDFGFNTWRRYDESPFFSRVRPFPYVLQPGNTPSLLPSVPIAPERNLPSNYLDVSRGTLGALAPPNGEVIGLESRLSWDHGSQ